ncbi:MAG: DUF1152 domain-containing protein [Candidatus Competibacteraceae bacterium]|nr:DUF1152 domain-containing protein [Candidatus Competibacteraceae bacterium]
MSTLRDNPILSRLADAQRIIVAGAGGGFDVYAGLPLALALHGAGKQVTLANLSFTYLRGTDATWLAPHICCVIANTKGEDRYFPERTLARWLVARGLEFPIFALEKVGVRRLRAAYQALAEHIQPDAIILVDGGTDILMFGDEAGLGTPEEDMTSLAAVSRLQVPTRLVACIGFGVDTFHGVCHAHFLENVAALERDGAYLGAFSVPRSSDEGTAFIDAVAHAQAFTPQRPSIVNGSIAAAIAGRFGNAQFTARTASSELFINPLMGIYFGFELEGVTSRSYYLTQLEGTDSISEVAARIEAFRHTVTPRSRRSIPH